ncbi:hypothetical protein phytr_90 [Candidatus Phycorickettsia trachydisci]|uniref:Uncharacterized protein n=1 Tax=Candidatus Phycorickettsia trachydisci TaxID=2115978 RepID=A0A2P1P6S3_9RICK|nr:ankyrin repeat domain-containing protein [Candidatus Phycorickettsia trachydisci]AVP86973.1 hypothetical protein phytr_90 [Candidatus Phycorickettsia trachydisci]
MAKNIQAEKKITDLLKEEIGCALAGADLAPYKLDEFVQFLSSLGGAQGTVEEFINKFNDNEFVPNIDTKRFAELSNKLGVSYRIDWAAEVAGVLSKVKNELQTLESGGFDFIQQDNSQVTFVGYSVKVSGVARFISTARIGIEHIRIFALGEVVVDGSLDLSGGCVSIIAPAWNIVAPSMINLKGKSGDEYGLRSVSGKDLCEDGIDGASGSQGGNGGHFWGIGEDFFNLENLSINVDGGPGGTGQNGGNGLPGQDFTYNLSTGDEAKPLMEWLKYTDSVRQVIYSNQFREFIGRHPYGMGLLDKIRVKWHETVDCIVKGNRHLFREQGDYLLNLKEFTEITIKQFHEENKHSVEHRKLFKKGSSLLVKKFSFERAEQRLYGLSRKIFSEESGSKKLGYGVGGNGGSGGFGGPGGAPGTHDIISLGGLIEKRYVPQAGESGVSGEDGSVGGGGQVVLKLTDIGSKSGFCCVGGSTVHTTLNLKAPPGNVHANKGLIEFRDNATKRPNLHLSIVDYQLLMGKKSGMMGNLSKSFSSKLKEIEAERSSFDFANELLQLEEYIARPGVKFDFLDSYCLLAKRIGHRANMTYDEQEVKVLKYLYTSALTRISQLKAAASGRLVIDIDRFLSIIKNNIEELGASYDAEAIAAHKTKYAKEIEGKIDEAKKFACRLVEDIENAGNMLDDQFKKHLEEIDSDIRQAARSAIDLEASKVKVQNAITKTLIFNTLGILVSSAGMAFGPPGAIVAKIVQVGIGMLDNPNFGEHDLVIENLEKLSSTWDTIDSDQITVLTNSTKPAMYALGMLSKTLATEKAKLSAITTAIKQAESLVTQLQGHKKQMSSSFGERLDQITLQVKDIHKSLEDKSVVAIEFNKAEIANFFNSIKAELSKITGDSADGFCNAINKMIQALETSMIIHEHIQEYKDQITFANYIAQINSLGFKESIATGELGEVIQKLEKVTQRNIALEQYYMAISVIKQWSFPFAQNFLDSFDKLPNFLSLPDEKFIPKLKDQMEKIIREVVKEKTYVSDVDHLIKEDEFTDEPFFVWSYRNYASQITDLLNGKQVFLNADIKTSPKYKGAIKFTEIKLQLKGSDDTKIKSALQPCEIELQHSGNSYYRFANKFYSVQHDAIKMSFSLDLKSTNQTFKKIHKASQENPMLSPYTWWVVTLKSKETNKDTELKSTSFSAQEEENSPLFNRLKETLPTLQIQLVGKGRFIDESQITQNFQVDTFYEQVITPIPQFRLQLKPKPNAFNQATNLNYTYQIEDIALIQSKLMKPHVKDITILPPSPSIQTIQKAIAVDKPVLFTYSQDNINWSAIAIILGSQTTALCSKKLGDLSEVLTTLGINNIFYAPIPLLKASDNAPLALSHMNIMAEYIKQNPTELINTFSSLLVINNLAQLRSEFAKLYADAVYAKIEAKKSVELPEFLAALNIPNNDEQTRELAKTIYNEKDHTMTNLITAAQNCDINAIEALAKEEIDIDKPDNNGRTLLHWAALHNDSDAIQALLAQDANIEAKDNQGWTPLYLATYYNECKAIQTLLDNGADIEIAINLRTPLLLAVSRNNKEAAEVLLSNGANIAATLKVNETSLHIAALNNNTDILKILIKYKAFIEAKTEGDWTALLVAIEKGNLEATQLLISNGANIHTFNKAKYQPIHFAASRGYPEIIDLLLNQGAKIECKEENNYFTPLHWAANKGHAKIISTLVKRGANIESVDNKAKTPLHWAAGTDQLEALQTLLDLGANIHSTSTNQSLAGRTSLHFSAESGAYETSKELLLRGANANALAKGSWTPLHFCSRAGHLNIVQLLIENHAEVSPANVNQDTPLHLSAEKNHYKIVLLLLTHRANMEAKDINDYTPLLTAAENNSYESVILLIHHGANLAARDCDGFDAPYLAKQKGHTEIIHLLSIAHTPPFESEYQSLIHSIEDDVPFVHSSSKLIGEVDDF